MTAEFIARMIGMILLGIAGLQVGAVLAELAGVPPDTRVPYVLLFMLVGALAGLILTPWLTTRPFRVLRRRIRQVPASQLVAGVLGLLIGLIIALLLAFPLSRLPSPFGELLPLLAAIGFGSLGMYTVIARQADIAHLLSGRLPAREPKDATAAPTERFMLLDTSVIIDGRIADISQTGFLSDTILVPRFVLNELQHIADSSDMLRRNRGRRGLDILNKLQKDSRAPIRITDMDVEDVREVDDKLVILAKRLKCPILTNDFNLNRVAELQGVRVLNINELANAVKTVFLPGEGMQVQIIQEGKELGQGVGYLDDGTMVVIEEGRRHMNATIHVTVTKVLQTAAGRMIFARPDNSH
ncbi:MAG TPA: PIN domain-containing protein [Anaerolineae bacterium]|nr:PIN domain-containing protein [Anaerolineae bacterium]